jgi:hypothetical protein
VVLSSTRLLALSWSVAVAGRNHDLECLLYTLVAAMLPCPEN